MATSGGSGGVGSNITRKFPFTFDTSGILTGAALYIPKVGDILHDAWIEIDTAWNGTTPKIDVGTFNGLTVGWWADDGPGPIDAMTADADVFGDGELIGNSASSTASTSGTRLEYAINAGAFSGSGPPGTEPSRFIPSKFIADHPIKAVVSVDGQALTLAHVLADIAPTLPLTIVVNVNDQFIFTPDGGGGTPATFTLAPGVYTTIAEVVAVMAAALDGVVVFSSLVTPSADATKVLLTMVGNGGKTNNGNTITEGNGGAAALGFTANPDTFANGTGGDTGSTQGAGILYLVTATPV